MPDTEITGAAPAAKRRARKSTAEAASAPQRGSRAGRKPAKTGEAPASPRRGRARRAATRRDVSPCADPGPPPSDPHGIVPPDAAGPDGEGDAPRPGAEPVTPPPAAPPGGVIPRGGTSEQGGAGAAQPQSAAPAARGACDADGMHPASRTRAARPTFKQTVLRAARDRFHGDRYREPVTEKQVDVLLVLLHQPGQSRSLVNATYDYLRAGMSSRHADVQIEKLRGTFVPRSARAAA